MIYAYIRVSTDKQTTENQRYEIERYCNKEEWVVDEWIDEVISGTKSAEDRALGDLLNKLQKDDTLIVAELSRLGRQLVEVFSVFELSCQKGIRLIGIKEGFRSDRTASKMLLMFNAVFAEIERDMISNRTKEALARRKAEGKILGRHPGSKNKASKLDKYKKEIKKLLPTGKSVNSLAKTFGVSRVTMTKYLKSL